MAMCALRILALAFSHTRQNRSQMERNLACSPTCAPIALIRLPVLYHCAEDAYARAVGGFGDFHGQAA